MLDGLDEEDSSEENGQTTAKKRRLSIDQVKALEKIFEVENRLDPERKVALAKELGLQPRQVAIWFQNRRARWKTKQLEADYNHLKANHATLKLNYNKLELEKESLTAELRELKVKLGEQNAESSNTNKEAALFLGSQNTVSKQGNSSVHIGLCGEPEAANPIHEVYNNTNSVETKGLTEFKDGVSDSDSSGVFNEDSNLNAQLFVLPTLSSAISDQSLSLSSSMNYSQFLDPRAILTQAYQQQFLKMEEQYFSIESCNIFPVDQAPTLCWYLPDQRN